VSLSKRVSGISVQSWKRASSEDQNAILRNDFRDKIRPQDVSDGLSNTVAVSERVSGTGKIGGEGQRRPFANVVIPQQSSEDVFVTRCASQTRPYNFVVNPGVKWRGGQPVDLGFNHYYPPNFDSWDCQGGFAFQLLIARSLHPSAVQILNADGSVRWIASGVDVEVWRALGTIAGAEPIAPADLWM
jgi:hypothetical protein